MFVQTDAFLQLQEDEKFIALATKFEELKFAEDNRADQTPDDDLEPEDDYGNIEYKLKLCDMTMFKINKRTTQMQFRLYVSAYMNAYFGMRFKEIPYFCTSTTFYSMMTAFMRVF